MAFKFKLPKQTPLIGLPSLPRIGDNAPEEMLTGTVQGVKASAPEERMAKALDKAKIQYEFRYTVGAPRGLPGWKELDFLILTKGIVYALEVDTAFTHRNKESSDVLHDAIIQNDPEINSVGTLWPTVIHADGDSDLASQTNAEGYVKNLFGK